MYPTLLVISVVLAGCTAGDPPPPEAPAETDDATVEVPEEPTFLTETGDLVSGADAAYICKEILPSNVAVDPNQTAFAGQAHTHDQWGGQKSRVIFDERIEQFTSGGGWFATPGAVVLAGAGRAEFTLDWDQLAPDDGRQLGVDLPNFTRSSGDRYVDYLLNFTEPGQTHAIEFTAAQNDPAHAERTRWRFKMNAYNALTQTSSEQDPPVNVVTGIVANTVVSTFDLQAARVTWTVFRTYDCLPVDPPHYEYWDDATEKLVHEGTTEHAWTSVAGIYNSGAFFGLRSKGGLDGTIPPGTGTVRVTIAWSNEEMVPVKFGIEYVTADQVAGSTTTTWKVPEPTVDEATRRVYVLPVHPSEPDGPYANESAWDFRLYFDEPVPGTVEGTGRFTGTVDWKVEAFRSGFAP